jgi:predicted ester cyclase
MSQDNIAIAHRWFEEVWNQRRPETIDELLAVESVCHADDGPIRGPQEFKERQHACFLGAFPDVRIKVEAVLAHGDQVVVRWLATGTHDGEGLGILPTNRPVTPRGITWLRIKDGKLMEGWQHSNIPEVIRGLAGTK